MPYTPHAGIVEEKKGKQCSFLVCLGVEQQQLVRLRGRADSCRPDRWLAEARIDYLSAISLFCSSWAKVEAILSSVWCGVTFGSGGVLFAKHKRHQVSERPLGAEGRLVLSSASGGEDSRLSQSCPWGGY